MDTGIGNPSLTLQFAIDFVCTDAGLASKSDCKAWKQSHLFASCYQLLLIRDRDMNKDHRCTARFSICYHSASGFVFLLCSFVRVLLLSWRKPPSD